MKILKKIVAVFIMFSGFSVSGQNVSCATPNNPLPCWYTPGWDWLDSGSSNWQAQLVSGVVPMGSPFTSNTNTNDMVKVVDALDYLPQQGWVLLQKDFGCIGGQAAANATPYFILYNKYRSLARAFLYLGNQSNGTRASVILQWDVNNGANLNNSLLTLSNDYPKPNNVYPITNNSEKHINYLNQIASSGGWVVTEYSMNFDPNTVNSIGNFQRINFDFNISTSSAISISGDFNFSTESATPKNPDPPTPSPSNPNLLDYIVNAKNFLGKAPKVSDLNAGFANIVSGTDTINSLFHTKFTRDLKKTSDALNNGAFKKFLVGGATIAEKILAGGYLNIATSVLDIFIGKSNASAVTPGSDNFIQPTVSKGSVKLNGTIVTSANPLSISMQLPGTSHKFSNGAYNCPGLPVYDCPLGLISLQTAPTIEMKKHSMFVGARSWTTDTFVVSNNPQFFQVSHGSNIREQYNSYKITSNLELALNGAVGVNIENVMAAFIAIQDESIQAANSTYDVLNKGFALSTGLSGYNELTGPPNPLPQNYHPNSMSFNRAVRWEHNYINSGTYILNTMEVGTKKMAYSTPFIDIAKFKNTVFIAQPAMKILLKLQITMLPTNLADDQTPIIYVLSYDMTNYINDVGSSDPVANGVPPPFTCNQLEELVFPTGSINGPQTINSGLFSNTYLKTNNAVTVNANSGSVSFVDFKGGNRVQMTPGFIASTTGPNTFRAYIDKSGLCNEGTNALTVLPPYFTSCTSSALDRLLNPNHQGDKNEFNENTSKIKMYVAPNPNTGNFKLFFNTKVEDGTIRITNMMGQEVYKGTLEGGISVFELNLSDILSQGTYFITWNNNTFVLNQKFIIE